MNKEAIQKKVDNISKIYKSNRSIPLKILTIICIFTVAFFISSNLFFKKDEPTIATELDKNMTLNNVEFTMIDRQYNPDSGLLQVNFKMKNNSMNKIRNYTFEVREKVNPAKIIESKVTQIDDENYVLVTKVSKEWGAISITVADDTYKDKTLKMYADAIDITENKNLIELDKSGYLVELCERNIKDIESEIDKTNDEISAKCDEILALGNDNRSLQEDKKYEIKSEQIKADKKIDSNKSRIEKLKAENKQSEKNIKEKNEKIDKLNEKIEDIQKNK